MLKKAVIVIPTYNEEDNISSFIEELEQVISNIKGYIFYLLVVDANSKDGTQELVKEAGAKYKNIHLLTGEKKGVGIDLKRGFDHAFSELKAEVVGQIDADFSHNPKDFIKMFKKIEAGYDLVLGSRYIRGGSIPKDWGFHRKLFSYSGNIVVRVMFGTWRIREYTTNFRLFTQKLYEEINKEGIGYDDNTFLPAFIYEATKTGLPIIETPIKFINRKYGESKIEVPKYVPNLLRYSSRVFFKRVFKK